MRIISGTHRGKQLIAPKQLPVRPTTDFAKESLFNILNNSYYFVLNDSDVSLNNALNKSLRSPLKQLTKVSYRLLLSCLEVFVVVP